MYEIRKRAKVQKRKSSEVIIKMVWKNKLVTQKKLKQSHHVSNAIKYTGKCFMHTVEKTEDFVLLSTFSSQDYKE